MDLNLQKCRKRAGFKTQKDAASALGVPERRYASWERNEAMMSLEQAYNCAVLFGCTIDEIAGLPTPDCVYTDPQQAELNDYYENSNDTGKLQIFQAAKNAFANIENRLTKGAIVGSSEWTGMGSRKSASGVA